MKKKLIASFLGVSLLCGAVGTYAGTIIDQYKTNRGTIATVEREDVHKNRIAIEVDGKTVKTPSWYANDTTYIPLREVSNLLGTSVYYDGNTQTAKLTGISGNYSKADLDYLKMITEFNYQLDRIDTVAGSFQNIAQGLSIATDGIRLYNTSTEIDKKKEQFNTLITNYNNMIDEVKALKMKANNMGLLSQNDIDAFNNSLNYISNSIDNYKISFDYLYSFYSYRDNNSFSNYLSYSGKGFDYALNSHKIIFTQQQLYYTKIANFNGFNVASIENPKDTSLATRQDKYTPPLK